MMSKSFILNKVREFILKHVLVVDGVLKFITCNIVYIGLFAAVFLGSYKTISQGLFLAMITLCFVPYLYIYNYVFRGCFEEPLAKERIKYFEKRDAERISRRQNAGRAMRFVMRHILVVDIIVSFVYLAMLVGSIAGSYFYCDYDRSNVWTCVVFVSLTIVLGGMIGNYFHEYFGDLIWEARERKFEKKQEKQNARKNSKNK